MRFADLFSGIGGSRIGFEQACRDIGITPECVFSVEIKKHALRVYNANFRETDIAEAVITDINDVEAEQFPDVDVLLGGFPCQPFSSGGKREGFDDARGRGQLFYEIMRIAKAKKPRLMILENVENIERHDGGNTLRVILTAMEEQGYSVSYKVINAFDCGVPQRRKRVFIVACRDREISLNDIVPLQIQAKIRDIIDHTDTLSDLPVTFREALMKIPIQSLAGKSIKDRRGGDTNIHSWDLELYGAVSVEEKRVLNVLLLERRKKHWAKSKNIDWMDGMPLTTTELYTVLKDEFSIEELEQILDSLVERKYLRKEHPKKLVNKKRVLETSLPKGYNINKGRLSFPLSQILGMDDVCPTLTATDASKIGVIANGEVIRRLNARELARVCGFPDSFIVDVPDVSMSDLYDLFGNMICPPVMRIVARTALKQIL
ncbi:DNA (cytosine-5-)-methyltransferase [Dishui Lake large algae virus 1]|nr:DNA (cytosine-5-)-methyltransferase [Dishui Lake large algae virus 1]